MIQNPKLFVSHIGYLCDATKTVVCIDGPWEYFEIQDMAQCDAQSLGGYENWKSIYKGDLVPFQSQMGKFKTGDFSCITKPGVYRIVLPEIAGHSYQFVIADGVFHQMPKYFLEFIHTRRSGSFENDLRRESHLDDGIRSDTGEYHDASGGWYDAGDLRKWMTMSNLPVLAFMDIHKKNLFAQNYYASEKISDSDWLTEAAWTIRYILKMQDKESGMFFEDLGGGSTSRTLPGMTWWYENHSGCCADNAENRFTDNEIKSGDDRSIRVQYNAIVQYINIAILLRFAREIQNYQPDLKKQCIETALCAWQFIQNKKQNDSMHQWTSVKAWRLEAVIELYLLQSVDASLLKKTITDLVELWNPESGFWYLDAAKNDSYRGIQHSAQPIIALCNVMEKISDHEMKNKMIDVLQSCFEKYIMPISKTNPFGIIPYGLYSKPSTEDVYHVYNKEYRFRYFMPQLSPQRVNHGLAGHWTGWAHALSLMSKYIKNKECEDIAWNQLQWLFGFNPLSSCVVSGFGYRNPMPHSRFHGYLPGGFCVGPRGDENDMISLDLDARAEWNSTEYWNLPVGNTLAAFVNLLPCKIITENKLG